MNTTQLVTTNTIDKTVTSLQAKGFDAIVLETKEQALEKIKELVPAGASVQSGLSQTLEQIGFSDYLKSGEHKWNNLKEKIVLETDPAKQLLLRKQATMSDYYLGSVHAVTEQGELVIASGSGSQLPNIVFNSPNLIFVVGAQKIVTDLPAAFERITNHVVPLENERMMQALGYGTLHTKTVVLHQESPKSGRKIRVLLVKESLGF
jgi:L-lactate utilization protein LutC